MSVDLQDRGLFPLSTKDGHTPAMQARVDAFVLDELLEKRENGVQLSDYQLAYLAELLAKEKIREEQARNSGWDPDPHTDAFLAKEEAALKVEPTTTTTTTTTETEEDEAPSPWAMSPERAAAVAKAHRDSMKMAKPIDLGGPNRMGLVAPDEDPDNDQKKAELIAEVLTGLFGNQAEGYFDSVFGAQRMASWNALDHPRGPDGRFIERNSPEAVAAAERHVKEALYGHRSPEKLKKIIEGLSILSVKQIRDLKKRYSLSAAGHTKQALIDKIADRLDRGRREDEPKEEPDNTKGPRFIRNLAAEAIREVLPTMDKHEEFLEGKRFLPSEYFLSKMGLRGSEPEQVMEVFHAKLKEHGIPYPDATAVKTTEELLKEQTDKYQKDYDDAYSFARANYKKPPPLVSMTLRQYMAVESLRLKAQLEADFVKIHKFKDLVQASIDGDSEAAKKLDAGAWKRGNNLASKYTDLRSGGGIDLESAINGLERQQEELQERLSDPYRSRHILEGHFNLLREKIVPYHKALISHIEAGGTLTKEQLLENRYETWVPKKQLNALLTEDAISLRNTYMEKGGYGFHAMVVSEALKAAQPKFEKARGSLDVSLKVQNENLDKWAAEETALKPEYDEIKSRLESLGNNPYFFGEAEELKVKLRTVGLKRKENFENMIRAQAERRDMVLNAFFPDRDGDGKLSFDPDKRFPKNHEVNKGIHASTESALRFLNRVVSSSHGAIEAQPMLATDGRAFAMGNSIALHPGTVTPRVVVHEFGHVLESQHNDSLGELSKAWAQSRIANHEGPDGETKHLGPEYEPDEVAAKDGFKSPYTGKFYPGPASEVLPMGLQALFLDPYEFYRDDPELFRYTVSVLKGWIL